MPVTVRKNKKGGWDIVEIASGKVVGHSDTKKKAVISAGMRNKANKRKK